MGGHGQPGRHCQCVYDYMLFLSLFFVTGVDAFDPSKYPSESFRRSWISTYLKKFNQNEEVDENELNLLISNVEKFSLASHFFWGIWSLIQAANSTIDFDFRGYVNIIEKYFDLNQALCFLIKKRK